jgi:hypothetical protein
MPIASNRKVTYTNLSGPWNLTIFKIKATNSIGRGGVQKKESFEKYFIKTPILENRPCFFLYMLCLLQVYWYLGPSEYFRESQHAL